MYGCTCVFLCVCACVYVNACVCVCEREFLHTVRHFHLKKKEACMLLYTFEGQASFKFGLKAI